MAICLNILMNLREIQPVSGRLRKRRAISASLRDYVAANRLRPGTRLPTTHALARRFRASYVTVHSAMDDLVREGWLTRHQGKGTFVADRNGTAQRPQTSQLVIVMPPQRDILRAGYAAVVFSYLEGCSNGAAEAGASVSMLSIPSEPTAADTAQVCRQVMKTDGALFIGTQFADLIARLRKAKFPHVVMAERRAKGCLVDHDQAQAMALAAEHLVGHGYRRIGFFGLARQSRSNHYLFFRRALADLGCPIHPASAQLCGYAREAPAAARALLGRRPLPDAVFVDHYDKAVALMRALEFKGVRVPADIAVLGYGTEHGSGTNPPLSLVEVPATEIGYEAAIMLDKVIRGALVSPARKILPARLVIRQSCGCRQGRR